MEENPDYFYSTTLGKYIAYIPLSIDDRTAKAAKAAGIDVQWDDEGRINFLSYPEAKALFSALESQILTLEEYWKVYHEAVENNDVKALEALQSDTFVEWLDVVFHRHEGDSVAMIERPRIENDNGLEFYGQIKTISQPDGRPGWFTPYKNIDPQTSMPVQVESENKGDGSQWKYWSTYKIDQIVGAIRGFVTSSGTASFDLDIPYDSKQPVLMVRETREQLHAPMLRPELLREAEGLLNLYSAIEVKTAGSKDTAGYDELYQNYPLVLDFLKQNGHEFLLADSRDATKLREKCVDILGVLHLQAKYFGDIEVVEQIQNILEESFGIKNEIITYQHLVDYLESSKLKIQESIALEKKIVFVIGHQNPDTDTVISSLFEAYRNSILDPETTYIPVLQAGRMPDEIRELLGKDLSAHFLTWESEEYKNASKLGQTRWILVDHNVSEHQRFVERIIDHHTLSQAALKQKISRSWEMIGSCSGQVAQKLYGSGFALDTETAYILLGATLMDTENRNEKKMTFRDTLIMDELLKIADQDEAALYKDLMNALLNTTDAEHLFNRDYKEDWGMFGFAVAKVKNAFDKAGNELKPELLEELVTEAQRNNFSKNFPLTLIKLVDYLEDNETIQRERMIMVFNESVSDELKSLLPELLQEIISVEFNGKASVSFTTKGLDYWGVGKQLSRKATAPILEPLIEAFNTYYFSESLGKYVSREFLKSDKLVRQMAESLEITITEDSQGNITNINYFDAKRLTESLGISMLSLPEYWKLLAEAKEKNDTQLVKHLQSPGFTEWLDTVIQDSSLMINHPVISKDGTYFSGDIQPVLVPEGVPALILPDEIDTETGLPVVTHNPQQYGDTRFWRYWSPDAEIVVPTRGHIFLLNQPALDMKVHPQQAFPKLGLRPCREHAPIPDITITQENGKVIVKVSE